MMDQDTVNYIIIHYLHLMSPKEKLAYKHIHSLLKLEGNNNLDKMKKIYVKAGWLTKDRIALSLIHDGIEKFYKIPLNVSCLTIMHKLHLTIAQNVASWQELH